jgi:YVTN family beta-propeller protein
VASTLDLLTNTSSPGNVDPFNGAGPTGITYNPVTQNWVVAAMSTNNAVLVDPSSGRLVGELPTGFNGSGNGALAVLYDPASSSIYLGGTYTFGLSVFDATSSAFRGTIQTEAGWGTAMVYDPQRQLVYVANLNAHNISIIDAVSDRLIGSVPCGQKPIAIDVSPDGQFVYTANFDSNDVTALNTTSLAVTTIPVGEAPTGVAVEGSRAKVWVTNSASSNVSIINTTTMTVDGGFSLSPGSAATSATYDAAHDEFYVTNTNPNLVSVYNGSNLSLVATVVDGLGVLSAYYDASHGQMLTADFGSNQVGAINDTSHTLDSLVRIGTAPAGEVLDGATGDLYVFDGASNLTYIVDPSTETVVGTLAVGPGPFAGAYDPVTERIFIAGSSNNDLTVVDGRTNTVLSQLTLSPRFSATSIALDAADHQVFVGGPNGLGNLYVVSTVTLQVVAALPVEGWMEGLAFSQSNHVLYGLRGPLDPFVLDPSTDTVTRYVATGAFYPMALTSADPFGQLLMTNFGSQNVSIIDTATNATQGSVDELDGMTGPIDYEPATGGVYIADSYGVTFLDPSTDTITGFTPAGGYVDGFAYSLAQQELFVSNGWSGTVSVLPIVPPPTPIITNFSARPAATYVGHVVNVTVELAVAQPLDSYTYSGLPPGCPPANASSLSCGPTAVGDYSIGVVVREPGGTTAMANTSLSVYQRPSIISFTVDPSSILAPASVTFTATVAGGARWNDFDYTGLPAGCSNQNASVLRCTPGSAGTYYATLTVRDQLGSQASAIAMLTVTRTPNISFFRIDPNVTDVGLSVQLSGTAVGGLPPYTFGYTGLPPGCATADSVVLLCTPSLAGVYPVGFKVTDSLGTTNQTFLPLTVHTVLQIDGMRASPASLAVGETTVISANVSGGTTPFTYQFTSLPPGCNAVNASAVTCAPTTPGNFSVTVSVLDAVGGAVNGTVTLQVSPATNGCCAGSLDLGGGVAIEIALVVVAASALVAGWVAYRRRRRKFEGQSAVSPAPPEGR